MNILNDEHPVETLVEFVLYSVGSTAALVGADLLRETDSSRVNLKRYSAIVNIVGTEAAHCTRYHRNSRSLHPMSTMPLPKTDPIPSPNAP